MPLQNLCYFFEYPGVHHLFVHLTFAKSGHSVLGKSAELALVPILFVQHTKPLWRQTILIWVSTILGILYDTLNSLCSTLSQKIESTPLVPPMSQISATLVAFLLITRIPLTTPSSKTLRSFTLSAQPTLEVSFSGKHTQQSFKSRNPCSNARRTSP